MGALRLTLRAELRRGWRPMLMLALLLGVIGGVVLIAAAGRRAHRHRLPAAAAMGQGCPGAAPPDR